jgi:hypothetical protein
VSPRTRTSTNDPELPEDEDGIHVGDDARKVRRKAGSAATSASRMRMGLPPRKRGRPAGPPRVAMNVRVLLRTDQLVTEIGEATGKGPQQVADEAIAHYAAHLRRTGKLPKEND